MSMGITYESSREEFDRISQAYMDYLALYAFFNDGSEEGATPFDEFYWFQTYRGRYLDGEAVSERY